MIIQTGLRTDIPAFYAKWFANRLGEGYALVRNPYNPQQITRYVLDPSVVDMIGFCSKNPAPLLPSMELLKPFNQYWFVTITPYGRELEPGVPPASEVMKTFQRLSRVVGIDSIAWRYDPIILTPYWTVERHIEVFSSMCQSLNGFTNTVVISFVDLYKKMRRNVPEIQTVPISDQLRLTEAFVKIGRIHGMTIKPCGESRKLEDTGADCSGCMTIQTFEAAIGENLVVPTNPYNRRECACYLTADIGAYNTCGHLCRYCYANADASLVRHNMKLHDPSSPLLIGNVQPEDRITDARQASWIDYQMRIIDLL